MTETLLEAGPGGYLVVILAMFGVGLAAFAASSPPIRALVLSGLVLALGTAAVFVGVTTTVRARAETFKAMAHATPTDREVIQRLGEAAEVAGTKLGLGAGLPVFVSGLALIALQFSRRKVLS
jgi:hypothetical protein